MIHMFTFSKILKMEEEFVEKMCNEVIAMKPDLVITEKGVSDLAQHYLVKAGISVIRRVRKSDNNRIGRSVILATLFLSKPPIKPCHDQTCLQGFRRGPIQSRLYSHRKW